MKQKEIKSWRAKSEAELMAAATKLDQEIVNLRTQLRVGKLKNVRAVRAKRRELAVVKTLLSEKKQTVPTGKEDK